jgi:branched-chain amino acid transport system ATP-binding protein
MAPLLRLFDVTVRFGGLTAVDQASFEVEPAKVYALIGPNGAGKTTLFNAIAGNVAISQGRIEFRGQEIQTLSAHEIAAKGVRRTFQNGGLFGELSALENILAGLHTQVDSGFFGLLFGSAAAAAAEKAASERARRLLELMEIGQLADQWARDLSGGQQRMLEILRALASDPPLLLLDEPAVGLAPPVREHLLRMIRRLVEEEGIAVVLIEHAIEFVMGVSDVIMVLNDGQVIARGTPQEVREDRAVLEAYLGR